MVNLRMARESDARELAAIYRPSVSERATSFELEPPNAEEMARRLELTLKFGPWPWRPTKRTVRSLMHTLRRITSGLPIAGP
jgi:L-amino acid N-acyltransferase YncA